MMIKKQGFLRFKSSYELPTELPLLLGKILPCSDIPLLPMFGLSLYYIHTTKTLYSSTCLSVAFFRFHIRNNVWCWYIFLYFPVIMSTQALFNKVSLLQRQQVIQPHRQQGPHHCWDLQVVKDIHTTTIFSPWKQFHGNDIKKNRDI